MARGQKRVLASAGGEARPIRQLQKDGTYKILIETYIHDQQKNRGKRSYITCGPEGDPRTDAKRDEILARFRASPKAGNQSVEAWANSWLKVFKSNVGEKGFSPGTYDNYEWVIQRRLAGSKLGAMPIAAVVTNDIVEWCEDLLRGKTRNGSLIGDGGGISLETLRAAYVRPVKKLFKSARKEGLIPTNPTTDVVSEAAEATGRMVAEQADKALWQTELVGLIKACEALEADAIAKLAAKKCWGGHFMLEPRPSFYIQLAFTLGVRPSEAYGLMWTDFTADCTHVILARQSTHGELRRMKSRKIPTRTLVVAPTFRPILLAHRQQQQDEAARKGIKPSLFVLGVKPTDATNSKCSMRRAIRSAVDEMPMDIRPPFMPNLHTFRHTAITLLYNGSNLREVQLFAGHTQIATTERYLSRRRRDLPAAASVAALDEVMASLG